MPSRRRAAQDAERRDRALSLFVAGRTYAQIAVEVGYHDKSSAHHAVTAALKQRALERADLADTALTDVLERLDGLYAAHWGPATGTPRAAASGETSGQGQAAPAPCPRSAEVVLKVIDRKIRLLGLDAPVRVDATVVTETAVDRELAELSDLIRARAAAAGIDDADLPALNAITGSDQ